MGVEKLKPEELTTAFLLLSGKYPAESLPKPLLDLTRAEWEALASLLSKLEEEKNRLGVH